MRISDWSSDVCSSDLGLRAMHDQAHRIHPVAIDQCVHAHERAGLKTQQMVVERGITAADRLEAIEEIQSSLGHRQLIGELPLTTKVVRSEESRVGKGGVNSCRSRW